MEEIKSCNKAQNNITLTSEECGDDLWHEVANLLQLLCKAGYECAVREEERGIVVIDFDYDRFKNYGNNTIAWLDEDEKWTIDQNREGVCE